MNVEYLENRNLQGSRSIADKIRHAIGSGRFTNGDQLPSERELSEMYDASRTTIRKALDTLEVDGMVSRKVGSGTFVTHIVEENDIEKVVGEISPIQLIDARIGFERQMLRLAVIHATARDMENLEKILVSLEASETDNALFTQLDSDFHQSVAIASGNPLILQLYNQINEVRTHSQWQAARKSVLTPQKVREYNGHHRQILDALKARDINAAIDALNLHMDLARRDLIGD
ncbi:MAG: FadR/GntR family transcriptional regulator [Hyphomicrobiales bacterium]